MNLISNKKSRIISIILTVLNIVFACYAVINFDLDVIFICSFAIIQLLIVLFYFIVFTFNSWSDNHMKALVRVEENTINKVDQLSENAENKHAILIQELKKAEESNSVMLAYLRNEHAKTQNTIATLSTRLIEQMTANMESVKNSFDVLNNDLEKKIIQMGSEVNAGIVKLSGQTTYNHEQVSGLFKHLNNSLDDKLAITISEISLKVAQLSQQASRYNESVAGLFKQLNAFIDKNSSLLIAELNKENVKLSGLIINSKEAFSESLDQLNKSFGDNTDSLVSEMQTEKEELLEQIKAYKGSVSESFEQLSAFVEKRSSAITIELREKISELCEQSTKDQGNIINLVTQLHSQLNRSISDNSASIITEMKNDNKHLVAIEKNIVELPNQFKNNTENQRKYLDTQLNATYDRIDALFSIHSIIKFRRPLPIMHDWTISSDYGHVIIDTILKEKKGSVIDVGSGISTILAGYAVQLNGKGKVISLEHSKEYYEKTLQLIRDHQLESVCELHLCPLIRYEIDDKLWYWYDIKKVKFPKDVNLMIVDGPPGSTQPMARFPAVPLLKKFVGDSTLILLDDGSREEEKLVAEAWEKEYGLKKRFIANYKGLFELYK